MIGFWGAARGHGILAHGDGQRQHARFVRICRKRDISIELSAERKSIFSATREGRRGVDVVFRVEQDHRLGSDGDDRRDGVGDPCAVSWSARSAWKSRSSRRRVRADCGTPRRATAPRPGPSRSGRCSPRPIRRKASRSPRSALHATPSTRAALTRSARTSWEVTGRERSPSVPGLPVLLGAGSPQRREVGPGEAQRMAVEAASLCQGYQDDVCRAPKGAGPRRCHRLSRHAEIGHPCAERLRRLSRLRSEARRCRWGGHPPLFPHNRSRSTTRPI